MNALHPRDAHALRRWRRPSALVDLATVVVRLDVIRDCIDGRPSAEPNGVTCE
jgi:hypothetical protein